jgi:hypothetical protein
LRPVSAHADIKDAAVALTKKGQVLFSPGELIAVARERGSTYPDSTLRTHIVSYMCVNASSAYAGTYPDLVRISRGLYRLATDTEITTPTSNGPHTPAARRSSRTAKARGNVEELIAHFDKYLAAFEEQEVFEGPSLYFHLRALEQRAQAPSAAALLADTLFLEYVYAVLPSWGMHRMGRQAAKVPAFDVFADSLRGCSAQIDRLWQLDITSLDEDDVDEIGLEMWKIIAALHSSTSNAQLVSGSKTLHHVLPALVPPIDRRYTFWFFSGLKSGGERESFLAWWPLLCEIARRRATDIRAAVGRPAVMATSPSKIIDNAIVGFRLRQRSAGRTALGPSDRPATTGKLVS